MAKFHVLIPCTMSIQVAVEASSEQEAKDKALDVSFGVCIDKELSDLNANPLLIKFEAHDQVCKGNVFYGVQNEVEAYKPVRMS